MTCPQPGASVADAASLCGASFRMRRGLWTGLDDSRTAFEMGMGGLASVAPTALSIFGLFVPSAYPSTALRAGALG